MSKTRNNETQYIEPQFAILGICNHRVRNGGITNHRTPEEEDHFRQGHLYARIEGKKLVRVPLRSGVEGSSEQNESTVSVVSDRL